VHNAYPSKNLYFTEQYTPSTGSFAGDLNWHLVNLIIGAPKNWSRNVLEWNLATDASFGPHTNGGCSTCQGALTISGSSVSRNVSYYIIAHASKFVRPGAVRIKSSELLITPNVAFKNTDGSKVLIVFNTGGSNATFNIQFNNKIVTSTLPGGAAATYVW
jgi:glucosylceramidase